MIRHVVMWNFREQSTDEDRRQKLEGIRSALAAQVGRVPGLVSMDVALNVVPGPHARDLVLDSTFADLESLLAYHEHPAHHEARVVVDPLVKDTCGVDFETA